jgi:hypothetical protein
MGRRSSLEPRVDVSRVETLFGVSLDAPTGTNYDLEFFDIGFHQSRPRRSEWLIPLKVTSPSLHVSVTLCFFLPIDKQ